MNWIERMYEIKGKDHYSQNGEGLLLEYVFHHISLSQIDCKFLDIGGGDGFNLSNVRHLKNLGWYGSILDKEYGDNVTIEYLIKYGLEENTDLLTIDTDGNDYWLIEEILSHISLPVIIAEFNPAFTDSRAIKYNPSHEWAGDDYYGFSFEAGKKLAEKHGYEIIFNVANMNLIMVRKDLINVSVPEVTYKQDKFFKASNRPDSDWVFI